MSQQIRLCFSLEFIKELPLRLALRGPKSSGSSSIKL